MCTYILHFVCFGEEAWNYMHFLVILSLKTLWAGVKHWRTALHRFYEYRKPISSPRSRNLKVIQKCVHLNSEVHLYVFCLDNWSRILSGKPFKHIFHGKVKNIAISSDHHSPYHCHACISYLSFTIFFMVCDWGSPSFLWDSWPETPPPFFFKFSSIEKVFKIDLNLQKKILQFSSVFFRRHSALMTPS